MANPLDQRTSTVYDAAGRSVASINPLNERASTVYDAAGRSIASINPLGQRTSTVYDPASRAIAAIDGLGRRTSTIYDAAGRSLASVNPLSERTSTVYDAAGRTVVTVNPLGHRVSFGYDPVGRRTRLADANSQVTSFLFDPLGRDKGSIDPLGRRVTFSYDIAGRRTRKLDPRGNVITYSYDPLARRTVEAFSSGRRHTFAYDPVGNRTRCIDGLGITTTVYDAVSRPTRVLYPNDKRLTYSYDLAGRRTKLLDPDGGRFTYVHDAAGRLAEVHNPQDQRTAFVRDGLGRTLREKLANGAQAYHAYDAAGQLLQLVHLQSVGGGPLPQELPLVLGGDPLLDVQAHFLYRYDGASRRTSAKELDGTRTTWTYDPTGQLTREQRSGLTGYDVTYTYDPAGNRLLAEEGATRTTYVYDAANQLLTEDGPGGRTTYLYDASGNREQKEAPAATTYYSWNESNCLVAAEPVAGPVTMSYDADGRRVKKEAPSETRQYVYDFERVLQEADGGGATEKTYTSTAEQYGDLISAYDGSDTSYYQFDGLGSTAALLNDAQAETDKYRYRAFGLATHATGTSDNRNTFVGRDGYRWDPEIELYLLDKRYYDPRTARFPSEDPSGYADDINLYRYVRNDPVNGIDPSGTTTWVPKCVVKNGRSEDTDLLGFFIYQASRLPYNKMDTMLEVNTNLSGTTKGNFVDRQGNNWGNEFYAVNLYKSLSPEVWEYLRDNTETLNMDIRSVRESINDRSLIIKKNPNAAGISWYEYIPPGEPNKPINAPTIFDAVLQAGEKLHDFYRITVEGVLPIVKVAFLKIIASVSGERDDSFLEKVRILQRELKKLPGLLTKIAKDPRAYVSAGLRGAQEAFEEFFDPKNVFTNVLTKVYEWIFKQLPRVDKTKLIDAFRDPANIDWSKLLQLVFDLAGLTWTFVRDSVVEALHELKMEGRPVQGLVGLLEGIDNFLFKDADIFGKLKAFIDTVKDGPKAFVSTLVEKATVWVRDEIAAKILRWIAGLALTGLSGIGALVPIIGKLYKAIRWLYNNVELALELMAQVLKAVNTVANLKVGDVKKEVRKALDDGLELGLGLGIALLYGRDFAKDEACKRAGGITTDLGKKARDLIKQATRKLYDQFANGGNAGEIRPNRKPCKHAALPPKGMQIAQQPCNMPAGQPGQAPMAPERQGLQANNASVPCVTYNLMPGKSELVDSKTIGVYHRESQNAKLGTRFNYVRVRKVVANLKLLGHDDSRNPSTWMQQLIQYGDIETMPPLPGLLTIPGVSLGLVGDHVGHIIGNQFGGYADKDKGNGNVFPQHGPTNVGEFSQFETNTIGAAITGVPGCDVCVEIEFFFDQTSRTPHRPSHFVYRWWIGPTQQPESTFQNPRS